MPRKYTEAQKRSARKWDEANIDRLSVAAPKGTKAEIKSAAAAQNQSISNYILEAVRRRMESERMEAESETASGADPENDAQTPAETP